MDFGTLMMSMGTPNGMLPGINIANMPTPMPMEGQVPFVDLLGLVEGMEVSELSSASDQESNFAATAEIMKDEVGERVSADKVVALAGLGIFKNSVGQEPALKMGDLEMELDPKVAREIAIPSTLVAPSALVTPSALIMNAPEAMLPEPDQRIDAKSVAAWTTAFAAGEVAEIEVSNALPEGAELSVKRNGVPSSQEMLSGLVAKDVQLKEESSDKQGFVPMASMIERISTKEPAVRGVEATSTQTESDKKPGGEKKSSASMDAKDFFLERPEMRSEQTRSLDRGVLATSVTAGSTDMKTSDRNVVDFVSDKVLSLQNAGGGTLRVGLETADKGQIEIKVSVRNGVVDVRITGDNGELTRQLESSRSDLSAKLEQHLTLGDLKIGSTQMGRMEDARQSFTGVTTAQFTEDLVREVSRGGIEMHSVDMPKNERLDSLRMAEPLAKSGESASNMDQGFSRDERRDEALERWAKFSNLRKSA